MTTYKAVERGTGRQAWRVLIDGELQRNDTGRVCIYSQAGANAAIDAMEAATAAQEAQARQAVVTNALAPQRVLNPAQKRLDGLTHEEAAARGYGQPSNRVLHLGTKGSTVWLAIGSTTARYTVKGSEVSAVTVSDTWSGAELYTGTVEALGTAGRQSKHLLKLLPWMEVSGDTLTRYLEQEG